MHHPNQKFKISFTMRKRSSVIQNILKMRVVTVLTMQERGQCTQNIVNVRPPSHFSSGQWSFSGGRTAANASAALSTFLLNTLHHFEWTLWQRFFKALFHIWVGRLFFRSYAVSFAKKLPFVGSFKQFWSLQRSCCELFKLSTSVSSLSRLNKYTCRVFVQECVLPFLDSSGERNARESTSSLRRLACLLQIDSRESETEGQYNVSAREWSKIQLNTLHIITVEAFCLKHNHAAQCSPRAQRDRDKDCGIREYSISTPERAGPRACEPLPSCRSRTQSNLIWRTQTRIPGVVRNLSTRARLVNPAHALLMCKMFINNRES